MSTQYPTLRARVLAEPSSQRGVEKVDEGSLHRIRKAFALAESSPSQEAAAIKLAHKLMQKHNISRADVYENAKTPEERATLRGESVVQIERNELYRSRNDSDKITRTLPIQGWFSKVGHAMITIFDCKFYTINRTTHGHIHFVFGGIAANAAMAAEGFEVALNTALNLALAVRGHKQDFYIGFGDGLLSNALKQRRQEAQELRDIECQAQHPEKLLTSGAGDCKREERNPSTGSEKPQTCESAGGQLGRTSANDGMADRVVDNQDDDEDQQDERSCDEADSIAAAVHILDEGIVDTNATLEKEYEALLNAKEDVRQRDDGGWKDGKQLALFRKNAKQIAVEWMAEKSLRKGRKSTARIRDHDIYREGREEGAHHDVKRKRLAYAGSSRNANRARLEAGETPQS